MTYSPSLDRIVVRFSDDPAKNDLELMCDDCGEHLCDVEHGDTLSVLVSVADDHRNTCHSRLAAVRLQ